MRINQFSMTIGGKAILGGEQFPVIDPATGETIAHVPNCTQGQLDEAVAAARAAFPQWRATPLDERRQLLVAMAGRLDSHVEELARLLTREQGKPLDAARMEVIGASFWFQHGSTLTPPVTILEDSAERRCETRQVPLGVIGAIAPWNYPVHLASMKLVPALLAGNCVVLKPSPFTPLATLRIGEIMRDLLPPGVLNVVSGLDQLGPWMTGHPDIDKISFTGSTATGRRVMASAAASLKRLTLELGGNDAAIVLPDADVQEIVPQLFWAAFQNSGQICVATKRLYVHEDIYESFKEAFVEYARAVKVGNGLQQDTQLGPLQNRPQYERVLDLIEDAKAKGYDIPLGGEKIGGDGYFVPVTIIDNPPDDSRIVVEEQFGPVLPLLKFTDADDVIRRANDSDYGLAGSVWSSDIDQASAIAERLETGTVWINEAQYMTPFTPFSGRKQSGLGVENGLEGLLEFTATQTLVTKRKAGALAD